MSIDITNHLIPYTTVKQMLAVAYKTGFHAGIKWAKEGGIRRAREAAARDKPANPVPLTRA